MDHAVQKSRKEGKARLLLAAVAAALGVGLLVDAAAVSGGIQDGLAVCGNVLIPSLFPFMVLSGFISRTSCAGILSMPLTPVTTKMYKLPAHLGVVVLLGLIGGYPVGARMVASLLERGEIDRRTAQRMLCFCVNSGPSFLISAVGVGMLMNKKAGVILFATQTFATLLVGAVASIGEKPVPSKRNKGAKEPLVPAFVDAVTGASGAMLTMCSFAVLFSGVLALIRSVGFIEFCSGILPVKPVILDALVCGFFEVTAGCLKAASVGGAVGFALICGFASFSGLSVLFQIMSCFPPGEMQFRSFIYARIAHAGIAIGVGAPLYHFFCKEMAVWGSAYPPVMQYNTNMYLISGCLIAMCTILVFANNKLR